MKFYLFIYIGVRAVTHDFLADIEPCSGRNSSSSTSSQASHIQSRWHTNNNCLKVSASRCRGTHVEISEYSVGLKKT